MSLRDDSALHVGIESDLPRQVVVGGGDLLLVHGWCVHERLPVRHLELLVGGDRQPLREQGTPRPDIAPRGTTSTSATGFLGFAEVREPVVAGTVEIRLVAGLADGEVACRLISEVELVAYERKHWALPGKRAPRIAICMATYNPPPELFRRQIDSIRAQSYDNWICLISDDGSRPEALELIRQTLGDDPRFRLQANPQRLGVYRNFERALGLVEPDVPLVALADQDDRWDQDKLASLVSELRPDVTLVYSDARVTDVDGTLIAPTFWTERANNTDNLGKLLLVNSITGAASLFRSELLDYILPFPATEGLMHDHWLALVALAVGDVAYVERPLYDYVQHRGAALGHERDRPRRRASRPQLRAVRDREGLRRLVVDRLEMMRLCYYTLLGVTSSAELLLLRVGDAIEDRKRRAVRRCARLDRSPIAWAWLAQSLIRSRTGRSKTLGVERLMLIGALWRPTLRGLRLLKLAPANPHAETMAAMLRLPHAEPARRFAAPRPGTTDEKLS
jgi:glycosyltransferase involved in cell wall biosynthesis